MSTVEELQAEIDRITSRSHPATVKLLLVEAKRYSKLEPEVWSWCLTVLRLRYGFLLGQNGRWEEAARVLREGIASAARSSAEVSEDSVEVKGNLHLNLAVAMSKSQKSKTADMLRFLHIAQQHYGHTTSEGMHVAAVRKQLLKNDPLDASDMRW
jgi:hypothetical protein